MSMTNFSALTTEQKTVWSRDIWKAARNVSFINRFAGSSPNSMVQRIKELTKTERGDRAVITLVADMEGDGVAGDNQLDGNEEEIKAYDQVIQIDQLRNANRHKGRMTAQKSVVNFREQSKDILAYWLADRMDQMAFLTLSGVAYSNKNNGGTRTGSQLSDLAFAADVTAPSTNRHRQWDAANGLSAGDTSAIVAADTPSYQMLVELKAYAKDNYIRGIKGPGGEEVFHVFMCPQGMAKLKLDSDYLANIRSAGVRGGKNELFAGTTSVLVDGLWIHEYRHVYNTAKATSGSGKWGAGSDVDGQRVLFCGAQALGMADIGNPDWVEEGHDYDNQQAIATGKIFGFLKPVFRSNYSESNEDFGVIAVDTAI